MPFHLQDDFKAGAPISQVPASWFNRVAKFLNNLVPGPGIKMVKQTGDQPTVIELDLNSIPGGSSGGAPENPTMFTSLVTEGKGTATIKSDTWTYDGGRGLKVTICTRVCYVDTATAPVLYGFYRTFTFDKNGQLYFVSAEHRYVIDTPVIGNITS